MRLETATLLGILAQTIAVATPAGAMECTDYVYSRLTKDRPNQDLSALRTSKGLLYGPAGTWYSTVKNSPSGSKLVSSVPALGDVMVFAGSGETTSGSGAKFPTYGSIIDVNGHVALVASVKSSTAITVDHANYGALMKGQIKLGAGVTTPDDGKKVPLWTTAKIDTPVILPKQSVISFVPSTSNFDVMGFIRSSALPTKKK